MTPDHVILDYELLADMMGMGLSGKRDSLLAALAKESDDLREKLVKRIELARKPMVGRIESSSTGNTNN